MLRINFKNKDLIILISIIFVGAVLRLLNVSKMASFDFDQEYAANFAYSVIKEFPVQLIGQGLSVQGLFMGPWYFYFLVPFYFIFSLHPIGGTIGSIVLGLITIWAYYWVGGRFFGKPGGFILAFLRAILLYKLEVDWSVIPSMASELIVIFSWYFFWKLWKREEKFFPLLAFCFGLYTSFHPILFPFYPVLITLMVIRKYLPKFKTLLLSVAAFIIPLLPLIAFEFLHKFLEIKRLLSLGGGAIGEPASLQKFIYFIRVVTREQNLVFGVSVKPNWLIFAAFFMIGLYLSIRKVGFWKDRFHAVMLPATFLIFLLYYTFFPTHVPEYYFLGVTVLTFFYIGGTLSLLARYKKLVPMLMIILFLVTFVNIKNLYKSWNYPSPASLYNKEQIVKGIRKYQPEGSEFYVSYIKEPGWNFGFDYLFKYYKIVPQREIAKKPIYTIVIPKALSLDSLNFTSGNIGLIVER